MTLTEKGVKDWQEIVVVVFEYLQMLRDSVANNSAFLMSLFHEIKVSD